MEKLLMNGKKCLKMNLEQALELVLREAESSALGDSSDPNSIKVMEAIDLLQGFYEEYGKVFSDYTLEYQNNNKQIITKYEYRDE